MQWYQWFPGDYQRDTNHLSFVEDAAFRRLLDAYYSSGKLPANADSLMRICRAITPDEQDAVRKVAAEFFRKEGERLFHDKVEKRLAATLAISKSRSEAGQKGAARTNSKRSASAATNAAALPQQNSVYPEPEPQPAPFNINPALSEQEEETYECF